MKLNISHTTNDDSNGTICLAITRNGEGRRCRKANAGGSTGLCVTHERTNTFAQMDADKGKTADQLVTEQWQAFHNAA